jgi:hypothetical protein
MCSIINTYTQKELTMLTNCIAKAKLVYNKKLQAYKVQIAFNVHKKLVGEEYKYVFPVQSKCNYVSGDLLAENLEAELERVIATASKVLRTNNIVLVD